MKLINAATRQIKIDRFTAEEDEAWCVIGSNRSGIRNFFDVITGTQTKVTADEMDLPENLGRICFKDQQELYENELKNDDTDYMDRLDPGTLGRSFIDNVDQHIELIDTFNMTACMDKGYRQLSTGQTRKLLILSQISKGRSILAIQAPYEGLDKQSRVDVSQALAWLHQQKTMMLLFVHNLEDVPDWCTHLALMQDGKITTQGRQTDVAALIKDRMAEEAPDFAVSAKEVFEKKRSDDPADRVELVCLTDGVAGYGGEPVFSDLSIRIFKGDHTLVTGPNGCGKSTLLHVITGDHPACYQNDLRIFNIQRGTGESIWELKKKMGIVSPELHRNYYIPGSTKSCIISGLFDSIGIYQNVSVQQEQEAEKWLAHLGMADKGGVAFRDLTFADQRLVLIARALIKQPELLILDEPTQGLDAANRKALLDFLEEMTTVIDSTILYVSHREDEHRSFFIRQLKMG